MTRALADDQRMLSSRSRFDVFRDGDRSVFDDQERRGYRLFRNNCAFCHGGAGVGGDALERLGDDEPWPAADRTDPGRAGVTGDPDDHFVFVVPSLRNVAETGPWFHDGHDGHVETLEEAVRLMARHQLGRVFTDDESAALVAFLHTLTADEIPAWAYPP